MDDKVASEKVQNQEKGNNGWGIAAIITGVIALILCWIPFFGIVLAVVGIVISGIGLSKKTNKGLAITGLVLSIIGLLVGIAITIVSLLIISSVSKQIANMPNQTIDSVQQVPGASVQAVQTLGSVFITAENWNAEPNVDGLQFDLEPKDSSDALVASPGTISIKLWKTEQVNYEDKCLMKDSDLLESWDSIPVNAADYDTFGAKIRAQYQAYAPTNDTYATGCAQVTFTTPDGKSFVANEDNIYVNG